MSETKIVVDKATADPVAEASRIRHVLNAAGRSTRIADHMPDKFRKKLVALCGIGGDLAPGVRDKVITILRECRQEQKAEIEGAEDKE